MIHIIKLITLKSIYFTYFHSIMQCGIIFGENSSNSMRILTLQKKTVRIMVGANTRTPSRSLFKKLEILPIPCQYTCIFPLMNFVVDNQEYFQTKSSVHYMETRNKVHFHGPITSISCFQKNTFYSDVRIFKFYHVGLRILRMKEQTKSSTKMIRKYTILLLSR
jgi:hypothetical protein